MSTSKQQAARLMGISPRALSHYLVKYPFIEGSRGQSSGLQRMPSDSCTTWGEGMPLEHVEYEHLLVWTSLRLMGLSRSWRPVITPRKYRGMSIARGRPPVSAGDRISASRTSAIGLFHSRQRLTGAAFIPREGWNSSARCSACVTRASEPQLSQRRMDRWF
jgi:hypothetical protein